MADEALRACIGMTGRVPSSATFSRAFEEFAQSNIGDAAHRSLVEQVYADRVVWHVSRDATSISTWERPERRAKPPRGPKRRPGRKKGVPPKPKVLLRQQKQLIQSVESAIDELPRACATGTKLDSHGFPHWWNGYKLHADVDESGFPLSVLLTSASLHDSQAAIPLMRTTAMRTKAVLYQLMDAGYVGKPIRQAAEDLGQVPIVSPKASKTSPAIPLTEDRKRRMAWRFTVERFFANIKTNYPIAGSRYRGHPKVNLQLMLAVVAICAAMILKKAGSADF